MIWTKKMHFKRLMKRKWILRRQRGATSWTIYYFDKDLEQNVTIAVVHDSESLAYAVMAIPGMLRALAKCNLVIGVLMENVDELLDGQVRGVQSALNAIGRVFDKVNR